MTGIMVAVAAAGGLTFAAGLYGPFGADALPATASGTSIGGSTASGIDYGNLQANLKSIVPSFVDSLHDYGLQIAIGEANDYLMAVANVSNQTGQAIVGCLREGRNLELLNNSGVGVNSEIPAT